MSARISLRSAGALAAFALFSIWITWQAKKLEGGLREPNPADQFAGKLAPDFHLTALDGRQVTLSEFRGKKNIVVSFWASWCGPCRMELPLLRDFYKHAHPIRDDFEILAISMDDTREDAETAARELKLPFPVLLDVKQSAAGAYGVSAIPVLIFIDKSGKVTGGNLGFDAAVEPSLAAKLGIDPKLLTKGTDAEPGH